MAKVQNFYAKNQIGKLGGAVYYVVAGETRSRELAAKVTNPRTTSQMLQRVRWANLVNFYRANRSWMKYAFETKKANQSEYNKFMSLNVSNSPIYLTKQQAAGGACVAYPYIITQGSLPSVEHTVNMGTIYTNLYWENNVELSATMSVARFSEVIIENNPALQYGDQISFIRVYQSSNPNTGLPYIVVRKYELVLSSTNFSSWANYLPSDIIFAQGFNDTVCLMVSGYNRVGGCSFIISRTIGGKTYVSTQSLVVLGNETLIGQFSSQSQLQAAINSYGESEEAFLTSTVANTAASQEFANSILSLQLGDDVFLPNSAAKKFSDYVGKTLKINFAAPPSGAVGTFEVGDLTNNLTVTTKTVTGNQLTASGITAPAGHADDYVTNMDFSIGDVSYSLEFPVVIPNSETIGGLE